MTNPDLRVQWPAHITTPGRVRRARCVCGARYRTLRAPGCPSDRRRRFGWAKRQITHFDGDQAWYWSRRSLLWVMHYVKAQAFIAVHAYCAELAREAA